MEVFLFGLVRGWKWMKEDVGGGGGFSRLRFLLGDTTK